MTNEPVTNPVLAAELARVAAITDPRKQAIEAHRLMAEFKDGVREARLLMKRAALKEIRRKGGGVSELADELGIHRSTFSSRSMKGVGFGE